MRTFKSHIVCVGVAPRATINSWPLPYECTAAPCGHNLEQQDWFSEVDYRRLLCINKAGFCFHPPLNYIELIWYSFLRQRWIAYNKPWMEAKPVMCRSPAVRTSKTPHYSPIWKDVRIHALHTLACLPASLSVKSLKWWLVTLSRGCCVSMSGLPHVVCQSLCVKMCVSSGRLSG